MFRELGILWIDHIAVTTDNFSETIKHYLALPNARILRGPGWNGSQKVHYLFVSFGGDLCVEILGLPEHGESPIESHVSLGGGAYHLCYAVENIDHAVEIAREHGARMVVSPSNDDAYDGRRVAFLIHPAHGLFELVEATLTVNANILNMKTVTSDMLQENSTSHTSLQNDPLVSSKIEAAFKKTFQDDLPQDTQNWDSKHIKGWDSLAHLRLIMEIERSLDTTFPSSQLHMLQSFEAFLKHSR